MAYKLTALSLGAGVQSSTILLMACKGELPKPDFAIFADTGWESQATYKHLEWLEQEAQKAGIPIIKVSSGNIKDDMLEGKRISGKGNNRYISIPFHVVDKRGKKGLAKRQCTTDYKLIPISRELRKLLGIKPRQHIPLGAIELWIGISTDEVSRANISRDKLVINKFPLLQMKPINRTQCKLWLQQNYNGLAVPKSSCIGCPFHRNTEWRSIKASKREWQSAILIDEHIRRNYGRFEGQCYLHSSCFPLEEVDLRTPQEKGQLELFDMAKLERIQLFGNLEV